MKKYILDKVDVNKIYLYNVIGIILYSFFCLLLTKIIVLLFPNFYFVNALYILMAILYGIWYYKFAYKRSSQEIIISFNKKRILIDSLEIPINQLQEIRIKNEFWDHYPMVMIKYNNEEKISFRINKSEKDYHDFIDEVSYLIEMIKNK